MSTRATIHFCYSDDSTGAIVYRHGDGYPDGLGRDIQSFLKEIDKELDDKRFGARWAECIVKGLEENINTKD